MEYGESTIKTLTREEGIWEWEAENPLGVRDQTNMTVIISVGLGLDDYCGCAGHNNDLHTNLSKYHFEMEI